MAVLFISESKLKEMTIIHGNVDDKLITPIIIDCQDFYIEPILGTALYNQIKTQIPTLTAANITLMDTYIIPCLVAYIKYMAVTDLSYKFTNKNVAKKNSENSQPLSSDESIYLLNELKNRAEYRGNRLAKFLQQNSTTYPLYTLPGSGIDDVQPVGTAYTTGMVLDDFGDWCYGCNHYKNVCRCYIYK